MKIARPAAIMIAPKNVSFALMSKKGSPHAALNMQSQSHIKDAPQNIRLANPAFL